MCDFEHSVPGGGAVWGGVAPVENEASLQEVDLLVGGL